MNKNIVILVLLSLLAISCGSKESDSQDVSAPHTGDPVVEQTEKAVPPSHESYQEEADEEIETETESSELETIDPQAEIIKTQAETLDSQDDEVDDSQEPEEIQVEVKKEDMRLEKKYYVHASQLNVRSEMEIANNIVGRLELDDEVIVVGYDTAKADDFVEIKIVKTNREIKDAANYYVAYQYLGEKKLPRKVKQQRKKKSEFFVVQNIATKKLRVYRKFANKNHVLVFEDWILPGRDTPSTRSILGRFKILGWNKFYQDFKRNYAPWYKKGLIDPPGPNSQMADWKLPKYMEPGRDQSYRGPFGWYLAHLAPQAKGQWMHGTIGYQELSKKVIEGDGGFFEKMFKKDGGSAGCTRMTNEAITYLRDILPEGTPVFKIYAKETASEDGFSTTVFDGINPLKASETEGERIQPFYYVLTKDPSGKGGAKSIDRERLFNENIITTGKYMIDMNPTIVNYYKKGFMTEKLKGRTNFGNLYYLDDDQFQGEFQVDKGLLKNYVHPSELEVGGYTQMPIPDYIKVDA